MDEQKSFKACFTLSNLMKASRECYKGVSWKGQPQTFMNRQLSNCKKLQDEVLSRTYHQTPVKRFSLTERGKVREVRPVHYRDRVVQRCLCDNVLTPAITSRIIDGSSACLKGRGLTYAIEDVKSIATKCPADGWVLQYDFHNYFATINKDILFDELADLIEDGDTRWLIATILNDDEGGLELGSHVSQLCAVLYPTPLDEAILRTEGIVGYHRYMDDGIAFYETKEDALNGLKVLRTYADLLDLSLNGKKTYINRVTHPFVFCKMRFKKLKDGSVRVLVRKQQTRRTIKHAKSVKRYANKHPEFQVDLEPVKASLMGYVNKGDADLSRLVEGVLD